MSMMNTIKHLISASIAASALLVAMPDAQAAVPQTITQQGRLYDKSGMPINGTLKVRFAIYAELTDADPMNPAAPVWVNEFEVTFDEGYFSTTLGRDPADMDPANPRIAFDANTFDGSVRYIGITIDPDSGEKEMEPRASIQSVPYAMNAGVAFDAVGDIHPTSITVGGVPVIDATGSWIGNSSGLIGPTGATGATGPMGPQGLQGPQGEPGMSITGPTGPTGVVSTTSIAGSAPTPVPAGSGSAPWTFIGPSATLTVTANQR